MICNSANTVHRQHTVAVDRPGGCLAANAGEYDLRRVNGQEIDRCFGNRIVAAVNIYFSPPCLGVEVVDRGQRGTAVKCISINRLQCKRQSDLGQVFAVFKRIAADCRNRVAKNNRGQCITGIERIAFNRFHAVGDDHINQRIAVVECITANCLDRLGHHNLGNIGAIVKCKVANVCYAVFDNDCVNRVLKCMPRTLCIKMFRIRRIAIIKHRAVAIDRQRTGMIHAIPVVGVPNNAPIDIVAAGACNWRTLGHGDRGRIGAIVDAGTRNSADRLIYDDLGNRKAVVIPRIFVVRVVAVQRTVSRQAQYAVGVQRPVHRVAALAGVCNFRLVGRLKMTRCGKEVLVGILIITDYNRVPVRFGKLTIYVRKSGTSSESRIVDFSQSGRNCHRFETLTTAKRAIKCCNAFADHDAFEVVTIRESSCTERGHGVGNHHIDQPVAVCKCVIVDRIHAGCKLKCGQIIRIAERIVADLGHAVFGDDFFDRLHVYVPRLVAAAAPVIGAARAFQRQHAIGVQRPIYVVAALAGVCNFCLVGRLKMTRCGKEVLVGILIITDYNRVPVRFGKLTIYVRKSGTSSESRIVDFSQSGRNRHRFETLTTAKRAVKRCNSLADHDAFEVVTIRESSCTERGHGVGDHHIDQPVAVSKCIIVDRIHAGCKLKCGQIVRIAERIVADLGHAVFDNDLFDRLHVYVPRLVAAAAPVIGAARAFQRQHAIGVQRPIYVVAALAGVCNFCLVGRLKMTRCGKEVLVFTLIVSDYNGVPVRFGKLAVNIRYIRAITKNVIFNFSQRGRNCHRFEIVTASECAVFKFCDTIADYNVFQAVTIIESR